MNGKVKFFKADKKFGFITSDEKDYFFHQSNVENEESLKEEDEVTFEIEQGDRGPKAVSIKRA